MLKTLALVAALGLASAAAHAQTAPAAQPPLNNLTGDRTPEQQAQAQAGRLAKELGLSPEQQTQLQQLLTTQRQDMQTAIQQAGNNRRAMGQAMRAGRDKFDGQLKTVLTPAQYTKYQQLMAQRREMMRERRQGTATGDLD
jgi:Spy/CpxP family protein refolding chaperone